MAHRTATAAACVLMLSVMAAHTLPASDPGAGFQGWNQIRTERFQIIFEPRDEAYALHVASFADDVYNDIAVLLEHAPTHPIPVVIAGRTAWANGYYSPFPPSVTLFTASPSDRFLGARTEDWLRSLLTHELTHYIHLTAPVGPARILTPLFGPDVPAMNTLLMPLWWVEGITTYAESTVTAGGRGDSPEFALTYQAPLLEDSVWNIRQGAYASPYPPSGRIYTTGYLMVDYLNRTYGQQTFAQVNRRFARFPFFGLSPALKAETGRSASQLFSDALKERREDLPSSPVFPPLFSPGDIGDYHLPFATGSGIIGFASTLEDGVTLVKYAADGGQPEVMANIPASDPLSVSVTAGGKQAYFSFVWSDATHPASIPLAPIGYADIYRLQLASGTFEAITHGKQLLCPNISADGTRLVAIEPAGVRYRLVEIDLDTGNVIVIYEPRGGSVYEPQISPDGSSIVAIEIVDGRSTLVLIDRQGTAVALWPHGKAEIHQPRFVDDTTVFFGSDFTGTLALYQIDLKSRKVEHMLDDPLGILGAVVAHDTVVYATYTGKGYALRKVPADQLDPKPAAMPHEPKARTAATAPADRFAISRYRDFPRLNLWLPLPMNDGKGIAPGAWILAQSVLGRHSLEASAGWSLADNLPLVHMRYQYDPGPFAMIVDATVNSLDFRLHRQHTVGTTISIPLWASSGIDGYRQTAAAALLEADILDDDTVGYAVGQFGFGFNGRSAPKDFFGTSLLSAIGGVQTDISFQSGNSRILPYIAFTGQIPVLHTHHVLRTELDVVATNAGTLGFVLLPDGNPLWGKYGEAKARLTLRYRIPLGLFDQPVPYGGMTGMGLSLHIQSAAYITAGKPAWEEDVYAGARLTADFAIGSLATLRPYAGITVSASTGAFQMLFGVDTQSLYGSQPMIPTKIGL